MPKKRNRIQITNIQQEVSEREREREREREMISVSCTLSVRSNMYTLAQYALNCCFIYQQKNYMSRFANQELALSV